MNTNTLKSQTKWTSNTKHVEESTGEIIPPEKLINYTLIKTSKYGTFNTNKTKGHIEYTKLYRKNKHKQLELKL